MKRTIIVTFALFHLPIFISILFLGTGCKSVLKGEYNPVQTPIYSSAMKNVSVGIASVTDKREGNPSTYYQYMNDTGCYDRPVADIVRNAVEVECRRSGCVISSYDAATLALSFEIHDFKASVAPPPMFGSATLDLSVVVDFEWRNSGTGNVLARNERSEHRSRKIGPDVPVLPFASPVIRGYGQELLDDLLPRVIEKELRSFSETSATSSNAQPFKVVSYQYDAKTRRGVISVDMAGRSIEARDWVVKNIGKICSSKELLMEAGQENGVGGHYRVLNETVKDGVLTIEFTAGYDNTP
jgi:hypothetical protein